MPLFGFGPSFIGLTINLFSPGSSVSKMKSLKDCKRLEPGLLPNFKKPAIFDMLSWESNLSNFVGREEEKVALTNWLHSNEKSDDDRVSVKFVTGEGGTGKSRLAGEIAHHFKETHGWEAGFYRLEEIGDIPLGKKGTLIVIDYPEKDPKQVETIFEIIKGIPREYMVRVLFLTRTSMGEWEQKIISTGVHGRVDLEPVHLTPLETSHDDALEICNSTARRASQIFQKSGMTKGPAQNFSQEALTAWIEKKPEHHAKPLFLVAAGIHAAYFPDKNTLTLSAVQIVKELVTREHKRLWTASEGCGAAPDTLPRLFAMATIADGLPWKTVKSMDAPLREMLGIPNQWNVYRELKASGWLCEEAFQPVQPDIIGAGFIAKVFEEAEEGVPALLSRHAILLAEGDKWIENLCRIKTDMITVLEKKTTPIELLAEHIKAHDELDDILAFLTSEDVPHGLALLCVAVGEKKSNKEGIDDAEKAARLNNLSVDYYAIGNTEKAMEASKRAVEEYEKLAKENPAKFLPDLAASLNNISTRHSDIGDMVAAMDASKRALEEFEKLAKENPAKHLPNLAMSLHSLAIRHSALGDTAAAMTVSKRALEEFKKLAKENPAKYLPDLAMSLNNLSNHHAELGDMTPAMDACKRAVEIREKLAKENPAKFLPNLAVSLNNLSNRHSALGDTAAAMEAIAKAVKIREKLAKENPAKFLPDLATSLGVRGDILMQTGDSDQAVTYYLRAIEILAPFAEQYPNSFAGRMYKEIQRDLAKAQEAD